MTTELTKEERDLLSQLTTAMTEVERLTAERDDARRLLKVAPIDEARLEATLAAVWATLNKAGISHGQSVEGLEQALGSLNTRIAEMQTERDRRETLWPEVRAMRQVGDDAVEAAMKKLKMYKMISRAWTFGFVAGRRYEALDTLEAMGRVGEFEISKETMDDLLKEYT